jgi:hypothetical protein
VGGAKPIETVYWEVRRRGGQQAQLAFPMAKDELVAAFVTTAEDVHGLKARGTFFPEGTRTSLFMLGRARKSLTEIADTEHVQSLLGRPPRWEVADDRSLDFEFVARELTPMSSVAGGRRVWLTRAAERRLSLDALLVNAEDRTPIVAEIKVGADENAELGLIQALAAAAQLSSPSQLTRLHRQFKDFFSNEAPSALDVYVITAAAPVSGVRPQLARRAHALGEELITAGSLAAWIRRIAFLEMTLIDGRPTFKVARTTGGSV